MSDETVGERVEREWKAAWPFAAPKQPTDLYARIDAAVADLVRDNARLREERDGQLAVAERSRENAGKWLTWYQDAFAEARALEAERNALRDDNARLREALASKS